MLWSIKTKNSQIINFNHDQLINMKQKHLPQTNSQSLNNKKIQSTKTFQQLLHSLHNYQPYSKYIQILSLKSTPFLQIKKYRECIFYGEIQQTKKQGQGIMLYLNGRVYEGQWRDNYKEGKGYQRFANGSVYFGGYSKGKPHGYGKYEWENGEIYEGEWIEGLKNGSGIWRGSKGDSYIGEWKDGKANGYGVHTWINGNRFQGQFKECLKHGEGIQKFANGDLYKGSYQNGKPHGYGEYLWNDGSSYKGNFNNGLRNGKGIWKNGQVNSDIYEGQFVDQKKQGYGTFIWPNGSKYIGNFLNDVRQGYGQMYWIDGNIYKGEWRNGEQASQNLYCPEKQICIQYTKSPLEDIFEQFNPQQYNQFQQFDEPSPPEIVELKKYRARDITKIKKPRHDQSNINITSNIAGGFLLSKNFVTEAVPQSSRSPQNLSKRPSRLSMKAEYYLPNGPKIKHCQSTAQKKNLSSSSVCNYIYVNKPYRQKNFSKQPFDFESKISGSNNNRCGNSFTPKERMIKSSAGIRNIGKSKDAFIQQMNRNRFAILNDEQQHEIKLFSRSKNKSQIF